MIDGASHEFVIPAAARPKMVQIDPEGWLIKELDFEKGGRGKPVPARARRVRAGPARSRAGTGQDGENQARRSPRPWRRPGSGKNRRLPSERCASLSVMATKPFAPP